jgi:hypothetical protein
MILIFTFRFEAIPPKAPPLEEDDDTTKLVNSFRYTTASVTTSKIDENSPDHSNGDSDSSRAKKGGFSLCNVT